MNQQKIQTKIDNFALIVGAMKCGTTSLFFYLAEHPEIAPCRKKETFFFSAPCWSKGFDWYQSLWEDWNPNQHKIALEGSVDYTRIPTYTNAAERIFSLKDRANFKFIYIMRNPIDRIESHYTHGLAAGWQEIEKSGSKTIDRDLIVPSLYAMQIAEYYKRFPAENILLLNFDDLKTNPKDLLKQVCQFLEIDPNYEFEAINKVHNANKQRLVNESLWRRLKKVSFFRFFARKISKKQKAKIYGLLGKKIQKNVKLSPEQKQYIWKELAEDLKNLERKYGFDVGRWGIKI